MPSASHESAIGLRSIIDTSTHTVRSLKVLGVPVATWDIILVNIIVEKLDSETHRQWELTLSRAQYPTYQQLMDFLETRWQSLEMISMSKSISSRSVSSSSMHRKTEPARTRSPQTAQPSSSYSSSKRETSTQSSHSFVATSTSTSSLSCPFCSEEHSVFQCNQFKSFTFDQKSNEIRKRNLCFNCLRKGHRSAECRSSLCQVCNRRHHTLLHISNQSSSSTPVTSPSEIPSANSPDASHSTDLRSNHTTSPLTDVLLATAVGIVATDHQDFTIRALLDSGSQVNLISEDAMGRIGLQRRPASISINGIGANEATKSQSIVEFVLKSRVDPSFSMSITAVVVERITGILPSQYIEAQQWKHLDDLRLADPHFNRPHEIDVLLGADVLGLLHMDGCLKSLNGSPFAQETKLGHILFGRFDRSTMTNSLSATAIIENYTTVDNTLKSFWEIEDVPASRQLMVEDTQCERHLQSTHSRTKEGRYIVQLPFVDQSLPLGSSREGTIVRLEHMERRFSRNPQLHIAYRDFMQDNLEHNHMEAVPVDHKETITQRRYLPHHGTIQGLSTKPNLRVVFDASHKSTFGVSLTHNLRIGPKLHQNLFAILTRFRQHQFVFIAKIIFQKLWVLGLSWDKAVPNSVAERWSTYRKNLRLLNTIKIASVLLAKLMHKVVHSFELNDIQVFARADSQVVRGWLRSPPSRWKTFVANRISQIFDYLKPSDWRYVDIRHHLADSAFRGIDPSLLHNHHIWWKGPEWLSKNSDTWSTYKINDCSISVEEWRVKSMVLSRITQTNEASRPNGIDQLLHLCCTLGKLLRVTAYCRYFVQLLQSIKADRNPSFITVPELNRSFKFWVKFAQGMHFAAEIARCRSGENLSNRSGLRSLNPFVDGEGILRVLGRLKHSTLSYQSKHPIFLPQPHRLSTLFIAVHPGTDGLIRTATIKCQGTTLSRPVVKLWLLPIPNNIAS